MLHQISERVARFLERRGMLQRDEGSSYLTLDGLEEDPLQDIHTHSVTYRVIIGPQKGRKDRDGCSFAERHAAMSWAQRLKRVFNIDIETCEKCQGPVRILACVEDPTPIRQILDHRKSKVATDQQARPQLGIFE